MFLAAPGEKKALKKKPRRVPREALPVCVEDNMAVPTSLGREEISFHNLNREEGQKTHG